MRKKIHYRSLSSDSFFLKRKIRKLAEKTGIECKRSSSNPKAYYIKDQIFYEDSPDHKQFVETAKELRIKLDVFIVLEEWSHEELSACELIRIGVGNTICSGDSYEESYDYYNGCPVCGESAVLKEVLSIEKKDMVELDTDISWVSNPNMVVSEKIKQIIEEAGLTGVRLNPTKDMYNKDEKYPQYYHLVLTSVLPPMVPETLERIPKWDCSECKRPGVQRKGKIHYHKKDLVNVSDFNRTYEGTGPRRMAELAYHLIITTRTYQEFAKHNVKGCSYEPVIVD